MIIKPYKVRIFNIAPEPIEHSRCKKYSLRQSEIKEEVDLRDTDSGIDDQGYLGSCAANAIINSYENMLNKYQPKNFTDLSRLFLYYNTRVIEENVMEDYGVVYLSNAFKSLNDSGVCEEEVWPYDITRFAMKPSDQAYEVALKRRIQTYEYIDDVNGVKEVLSIGKPVVIGMRVFRNFMFADDKNFLIDLPKDYDYPLGGHAVSIVGYTKENHFIIKNSFGSDWGNNGYALLTQDYMEKYVFDRWHFSLNDEGDKEESSVMLDSSTSIIPQMQLVATASFRETVSVFQE